MTTHLKRCISFLSLALAMTIPSMASAESATAVKIYGKSLKQNLTLCAELHLALDQAIYVKKIGPFQLQATPGNTSSYTGFIARYDSKYDGQPASIILIPGCQEKTAVNFICPLFKAGTQAVDFHYAPNEYCALLNP